MCAYYIIIVFHKKGMHLILFGSQCIYFKGRMLKTYLWTNSRVIHEHSVNENAGMDAMEEATKQEHKIFQVFVKAGSLALLNMVRGQWRYAV